MLIKLIDHLQIVKLALLKMNATLYLNVKNKVTSDKSIQKSIIGEILLHVN